jgi:hypothetical protein
MKNVSGTNTINILLPSFISVADNHLGPQVASPLENETSLSLLDTLKQTAFKLGGINPQSPTGAVDILISRQIELHKLILVSTYLLIFVYILFFISLVFFFYKEDLLN